MSEQSKSASVKSEDYLERREKIYKTAYIVSIYNGIGELLETPFATFDRCLAEEMALAFAEEKLYENWFKMVHANPNCNYGFVSMIYEEKLSNISVFIKELKWRE
jgi:hypothetical protein